MNWVNVNDGVPSKGEYLCIVKTMLESKGDTYKMAKPHEFLTQCSFEPSKGWKVCLNKLSNWEVLYWTDLPALPER